MARRSPILAALLALSLSTAAQAQVRVSEPASRSLDRWQPGLDVDALIGVDSAGRPQLGAYDLWLTLGYGGEFLLVTDRSQGISGALVGPRLGAHLGASMTVLPRLQVGADLPLIFYQARGKAPPPQFGTVGDLPTTGVGDLRLRGKFHLLSANEAWLNIAVIGELQPATHWPRDAYLGDAGISGAVSLAVSRELLGLRLAATLGYHGRDSVVFLDSTIGSEVRLGLAAGTDLQWLIGQPVGVAAAWSIAGRSDAPFRNINETPSELLFEATWLGFSSLILSATAGFGMVAGVGTPDVRLNLGVRWAPRASDQDQDSIPDQQDSCPLQPEDFDRFEDDDGCPDVDNDEDGLLDPNDQCPNEPETKNGFEDEDGCPDVGVLLDSGTIALEGRVHFEVSQAILKPESRLLLDEVAVLIGEHPELERIRVEGHTDNDGGEQFNLVLSQDRAEAVRRYLMSRGVLGSRLVAKGFGESRPLARNASARGRAQNRRVEFVIEKRSGGLVSPAAAEGAALLRDRPATGTGSGEDEATRQAQEADAAQEAARKAFEDIAEPSE